MSKEILLIRNDDGEFELYDDTYDVVIHCKNRQGMKETCEILRKVGTDEKAPNALLMDPVDMAIAIRNHCKSRTGGCEGCVLIAHAGAHCAVATSLQYAKKNPKAVRVWVPLPKLPKEVEECLKYAP